MVTSVPFCRVEAEPAAESSKQECSVSLEIGRAWNVGAVEKREPVNGHDRLEALARIDPVTKSVSHLPLTPTIDRWPGRHQALCILKVKASGSLHLEGPSIKVFQSVVNFCLSR